MQLKGSQHTCDKGAYNSVLEAQSSCMDVGPRWPRRQLEWGFMSSSLLMNGVMACDDGCAAINAGVHNSSQAPFPHPLTSLARPLEMYCPKAVRTPDTRDSHKSSVVLSGFVYISSSLPSTPLSLQNLLYPSHYSPSHHTTLIAAPSQHI